CVHRALRRGGGSRRVPSLVPRQLPETLRPDGVHGGTDARAALADFARNPIHMGEQLPVRLILASGSPARRELLTRAGFAFEVKPSHIDEPSGVGVAGARSVVQHIAWLKAAAVAPTVAGGIVLAADTSGWLNGKVIGKPADADDARRILRLLGGTDHELWTGVCLWRRPDDLQLAWQERSLVRMARLSEGEIDSYLATR